MSESAPLITYRMDDDNPLSLGCYTCYERKEADNEARNYGYLVVDFGWNEPFHVFKSNGRTIVSST